MQSRVIPKGEARLFFGNNIAVATDYSICETVTRSRPKVLAVFLTLEKCCQTGDG